MRKPPVLLGIIAGLTGQTVLAQPAPGTGVDYTNNVRSQSIGTPGQSTNPADQLVQRQGLQELATNQRAKKSSNQLGPARPAKASELIAGAIVNDKTGAAIAKIDEVDADGVVVSIGTAKVKVPTDAFGHNRAGLLLDMTRAQFEQIVANANKAS
jgi:hypothetical protein